MLKNHLYSQIYIKRTVRKRKWSEKNSDYEFSNFIDRNNIIYKQTYGMRTELDFSQIDCFENDFIHMSSLYHDKYIWKFDETGLFAKDTARNNLLLDENSDCTSIFTWKNHITIRLCFYKLGESAITLVIGNTKKLRRFKEFDINEYLISYFNT